MFAVGVLLGFVGAGGSGFIISVLTVFFGFPLHTALATALSAMVFSSLSGVWSHCREGNVAWRTGAAVGLFGAFGAAAGSQLSLLIPVAPLKWLTAAMLFLSGLALWLRMLLVSRAADARANQADNSPPPGLRHKPLAFAAIGLTTGSLSGLFGIGSTPFIQIGLLTVLGMSLRLTAGTTMMIILPIAAAGGAGFWANGHLDVTLLLQVAAGIMTGTYLGAKFTRRAPVSLLKASMVVVPMIGGFILLW